MENSFNIIFLIAIYLALIIYITYKSFNSRNKNLKDDFFHGGRKFGFYATLMTLIASLFSAYTFVGLPGFFYTHGIGSFLFITLYLVGFMPLVIYYLGRKMWQISKKENFISPVEILTSKYNSLTTLIAGSITLVFLIPILAIQPIGIGKLLSGISSSMFPYLLVVSVFLIIVFAYSRFGGMKTIVWSDALQGTIMIILFILVATLFVYTNWDGPISMLNNISKSPTSDLLSIPGPNNFFTYSMLFSFFIIFVFIPISFPYMSQRNIIYKDEKVLRKALKWYPIVALLVVLPALFIGIGGSYYFPNLESGDDILANVLNLLDNSVITSLIIIAIIAAAMSTVDSMFLAMSAIFSRDVYLSIKRKIFNNNKLNVDDVKVGSIFSLFVLLIVFLIAINPPNLIISLGVLSASGFLQLVPTYIGSLYLKKPSNIAAIFSMFSGIFLLCMFYFTNLKPLFGFHIGFISFCLASIVYLIIHFRYNKI
jgi:SSS family solute:Na+ symporter